MGDATSRTTSPSPLIFVCEMELEGAKVAGSLRATGYRVVEDLPASELVGRAQVERPNVVIVDVDRPDSLPEVFRLRQLSGFGAVDFVYIGSGAGAIACMEDAIANEGSAYFSRPVQIASLERRIDALTGGPSPPSKPPISPVAMSLSFGTAGVSQPPPINRFSSLPPERPSTHALPSPGARVQAPMPTLGSPSLPDLEGRRPGAFVAVSSELQQLLDEAEERADQVPSGDGFLLTPEEELETVLPADVLATLDEPLLDEALEPDAGQAHTTGIPGPGQSDRDGTGTSPKPTTASGKTNPPLVLSVQSRPVNHVQSARESVPPVANGPGAVLAPPTEFRDRSLNRDVPGEAVETARPQRLSTKAQLDSAMDSQRALAESIARRQTGCLAFEHEGAFRRIVIKDGDFVTAASTHEGESLVAFLAARGDLAKEEAERLSSRVPAFGRHAGAALVAHGWLGQDQLWSVLRAHAEWIVNSVMRVPGGLLEVEAEPPGRLRAEPGVFGASTGPEVYVELIRRSVDPIDALEALGGEGSRLAEGPRHALLAECALGPAELELVMRAKVGSLADALTRGSDGDIAAVVHGLVLLGVFDLMPAAQAAVGGAGGPQLLEVAALDEEAIRARVRARLELVEEGDYFAVLGVTRNATGYEVRRAFLDLRKAFEPSRLLTPQLLDLSTDVRKIISVLEEAYEILRDPARKERYRRAIEGSVSGGSS